MKQQYMLSIVNERYKYVQPAQVSIFILLGFIFSLTGYYKNDITGFLWAALLLISVIFILYRKRLTKYKFFRFANFTESGFLWAIFASWFLIGWWMCLLVILLAMAQLLVKKEIEIIFSTEAININTFPKQTILWNQLQNVVIKEGLLTIDKRNNKLIQVALYPGSNDLLDETIFNEFCNKMIGVHYAS